MSRRHVIYVPGLGDPRPAEQKLVARVWRLYGVTAHYYPFVWSDPQSFDQKLSGLLSLIDDLTDEGYPVALIGVSAGASAALNAFAHRREKISCAICICGKINHFDSVSAETFARNPAFRESLAEVGNSLRSLDASSRKRILSLHPLYDGTVPIEDTYVDGAYNKRFPCAGHALSIIYADIFGTRRMFEFIQSTEKAFPGL